MAEPRPVVLAAGGTGGHVFPAEALAGELEARGVPFTLVTDARGRQWQGALSHRPIAISDECKIAITVLQGRDAGVHCDGQGHFALAAGDRVTLRRAAFHARFLYPEGHDYFATLREKLNWSASPEGISGAGNS